MELLLLRVERPFWWALIVTGFSDGQSPSVSVTHVLPSKVGPAQTLTLHPVPCQGQALGHSFARHSFKCANSHLIPQETA